jgi:hypothetical protein
VLPISGASCRHAGTTPARSRPRRRAERSVRSTEPTRPERRRSASGLGSGRMRARSASRLQIARCCHRGCRLPTVGQKTLAERAFSSRHHRSAPSRALRPRGDSTKPGSFRSADSAVTRRWRACNPVVKDQHPGSASIPPRAASAELGVGVAVHAASPASTRGAFAAPAFSSGGASARRASGAPGSSALTGVSATATAKIPRRLPGPPRER